MIINLFVTFIKMFFMNFCIGFSFMKIKGCKDINKVKIYSLIFINVIVGISYSIIYALIDFSLYSTFLKLLCYIVNCIILSVAIGEMDRNFTIAVLLSICISLSFFSISCIITFSIMRLTVLVNITNIVFEYILTGCIQVALICYFFKIKRFKNGLSFINEKRFSKNIDTIGLVICVLLLVYAIFMFNKDNIIATMYFIRNCNCNYIYIFNYKEKHHKSLQIKNERPNRRKPHRATQRKRPNH